jgi:hypothetical protein
MIKLKDLISEACWKGYKQLGMKDKGGRQVPNCVPENVESIEEDASVFKAGEAPVMERFVFWDEKGGLKDPKKREAILSILKDAISKSFSHSQLNPNSVIDGLKYYEQTDKIVGNYPRWAFIDGIRWKGKYNVTMERAKQDIKYKLQKISKTLQVKTK